MWMEIWDGPDDWLGMEAEGIQRESLRAEPQMGAERDSKTLRRLPSQDWVRVRDQSENMRRHEMLEGRS